MTRVEWLTLAAALPAGILIGAVDTRADEVQPAVALLLVAGAGLGALAPRVAVPIGVVLGLGVPIVDAWTRLNHLALPYAMNSYWGSFLALIPATLGALAAAWGRGRMANA
jgi:hypothetical protein